MSFKRKVTSKTAVLPGTRPSPGSIATTITSTGIPSLDDILGGGLPLSCSLVVAAPDPHSSYGELVQKTFVSQGLACKQDVLVVGGYQNALDWVKGCMWFHSSASQAEETGEDEKPADEDQKIKIAWRYEQMKQFQTTVGSTSVSEDFCRIFDLTTRIPAHTVEKALQSGQLIPCDVLDAESRSESVTQRVLDCFEEVLSQRSSKATTTPLRICIPGFGSSAWGDLRSQDILRFLHRLRSILQRNPSVCASISLEPHISTDAWGGQGWIQKLGWMCDGLITLDAFTINPSLSTLFPSHHGMVHIHTLPSPHTLLSPSDRFSTLRGLAASATEGGSSSGENNLAFKCTRKRLIFETMHLDVEGGVGERRTTPAANTGVLDSEHMHTNLQSQSSNTNAPVSKAALASVEVKVEVEVEPLPLRQSHVTTSPTAPAAKVPSYDDARASAVQEDSQAPKVRPKKPKKTVAFRSDRPDLYDF
ncbi:PAXNEB-domain-containing protein [Gymnopus androsaceus JB14]|uniref:Elongator complex protein 4 n=1 Tax=Gymnopus androsaceus JB14 TaxID=1447944 RepID=A0A6A4IK91_9AGAR|nr:PAXNEB-domain-containing protein [Gymnopus androsaceus JB14]